MEVKHSPPGWVAGIQANTACRFFNVLLCKLSWAHKRAEDNHIINKMVFLTCVDELDDNHHPKLRPDAEEVVDQPIEVSWEGGGEINSSLLPPATLIDDCLGRHEERATRKRTVLCFPIRSDGVTVRPQALTGKSVAAS